MAKTLPGRTPQAEADRKARLEREAAALRANLQRRKSHQRAQQNEPDHEDVISTPRSALD